jgi:cbb3-type cytochrome oxidase maturation protein
MSAFFILIGCSLPVAALFLWAFIRSTKSGQWDDVHTPAIRMLHDATIKEPDPKTQHDGKQQP